MNLDFNPYTNTIIIPYIDLKNNDVYYQALPNISYISKFIKEILINNNERYDNKGTQRYNTLNYFICMNSSFKCTKNIFSLYEFENEPQLRYKYDFNIKIDIDYSFDEFKNTDKIKTKYINLIQ
jgi:hypothetical protein